MDYPTRFPNGIICGALEADSVDSTSGTFDSLAGGVMTGTSLAVAGQVANTKIMFTAEGGLAVKLTNKTGAPSVKGTIVDASATVNNAFALCVKDVPDVFGAVYEAGVADGSECWVVISGIADVLFTGNTTRGQLARGYLTADGAGYIAGYALAENVPTSPFASDKHFYEIGHVLESRTGAGLAKCVLHFN